MRASLFITCYNDTLFPETGRAVVRLLERLGVEFEFRAAADLLRADARQYGIPRRGLFARPSASCGFIGTRKRW